MLTHVAITLLAMPFYELCLIKAKEPFPYLLAFALGSVIYCAGLLIDGHGQTQPLIKACAIVAGFALYNWAFAGRLWSDE